MGFKHGIVRNQLEITSLDNQIHEYHFARLIDRFVDGLNMKELGFDRVEPKDEGRPPFDPSDLLKLYIYCYHEKTRSSRDMERECFRNIEVMWLIGKLTPHHSTIAAFRKNNAKAFPKVFRRFTEHCKKLDIVSDKQIVIDGSKFKAVNSPKLNFTRETLTEKINKIEENVAEYLALLDKNDLEEDIEELENKDPKDYTKEELEKLINELNKRKDKYSSYLNELIESGEKRTSVVDPEAKMMLCRGKFDVCYNVQTAVESKNHIITDFLVTDHCNDIGLLEEVTKGAKEAIGVENVEIIADKGYRQKEDILNCLLNGDTPQVPTFDKQDCYKYEFPMKDSEITDELLKSTDKQDMLKCISAGVLPESLKDKNVKIEIVEEVKEKPVPEEKAPVAANVPPIQEFFERDLETDTVICPMGQTLRRVGTTALKGARYANSAACRECKNKCTTSKNRSVDFRNGKTIVKTSFYTDNPRRAHNKKKEKTETRKYIKKKVLLKFYPDKEKIKRRGSVVEHPFGTIKR